jgi:hypothetical protein
VAEIRTIEHLLSEGEAIGHRSRDSARKYLSEIKKSLGLADVANTAIDTTLEDFLMEAVLGAAWYAHRYQNAGKRTRHYIWLNVAVVLAIPIGLILLGAGANYLGVNIIASQLAGTLTGVLGLQKTLSAWYASQQRCATWYKSGADLKSIYYGFVGRWGGKGTTMEAAILADCAAQTVAARKVIDDEQLNFYQRLAAPTSDVLDLLTGTGTAVSSFVTSLLPGEPPSQVTMVGRNALITPAGAPGEITGGAGPTGPIGPVKTGVTVHSIGAAKPNDNPYTIVILANPALQKYDNTLARDPIMDEPDQFQRVVENTIAALFGKLPGQAEKFLARFQAQTRIVSIFDPDAALSWGNALVAESSGLLVVPLWQRIPDFVRRYQLDGKPLVPDVVIAMTSSPEFIRSGSWPTKDDPHGGGKAFIMDNVHYMHAYRNQLPGMTALHSDASPITALHEFSHAASSWENGYVYDLYNDVASGVSGVVLLNKRWGRPIPQNFDSYAGQIYKSDLEHVYPMDWTSFHCERVNMENPALMDDFLHASPGPSVACQHDKVTAAFLADRIQAIMSRP